MTIWLVRHAAVALHWRGRCYGQSDVGLSRDGQRQSLALVARLAALGATRIVHSDMRRTRAIADPLARQLGVAAVADPRWRERDFGRWEGRSWQAIYWESGSAMDGMLYDPAGFWPGGGETSFAMRDRVVAAWRDLWVQPTIIVTHGGPIAALRGVIGDVPPSQWATLIPATGEIVALT